MRGTAGAADNGRVAQYDTFVFNGFDGGGRNIHHQVTLTEIAGHGLDAHKVGLQLRQADLRGDIERLGGVLAADAISRKAVTGLETLQRAVDIGVEGTGNAGFARQVARYHQTLAQRLNGGIGDADLQTLLGYRHFRPSAILHDLLILHDRLLHVDRGFAAENRIVGDDTHGRTRGIGIELVIPVATARRAHEIVQRVLRKSRRSKCCNTNGNGRTQQRAARYGFGNGFFCHSTYQPLSQAF